MILVDEDVFVISTRMLVDDSSVTETLFSSWIPDWVVVAEEETVQIGFRSPFGVLDPLPPVALPAVTRLIRFPIDFP